MDFGRRGAFLRVQPRIDVAQASLDSLKAELLRKEDPEDSTPEKIEDPQGFRIP